MGVGGGGVGGEGVCSYKGRGGYDWGRGGGGGGVFVRGGKEGGGGGGGRVKDEGKAGPTAILQFHWESSHSVLSSSGGEEERERGKEREGERGGGRQRVEELDPR